MILNKCTGENGNCFVLIIWGSFSNPGKGQFTCVFSFSLLPPPSSQLSRKSVLRQINSLATCSLASEIQAPSVKYLKSFTILTSYFKGRLDHGRKHCPVGKLEGFSGVLGSWLAQCKRQAPKQGGAPKKTQGLCPRRIGKRSFKPSPFLGSMS